MDAVRLIDLSERLVERLPCQGDAVRQAGGLSVVDHRPWPLPQSRWLMAQTWLDLLFAHWPVAPEQLSGILPPGVEPDLFEGRAWIGVTPFEVAGVRVHGTTPVPLLSRFCETNVRTYVTFDGKPGIWFLSLDAASSLAVFAARRAYRLPYFRADMQIERTGASVHYISRRVSPDGEPAELAIEYEPAGPRFLAAPGTLEHFLTERYCLYTMAGRQRVMRADIHHPPWPLRPARAEIERMTMAEPYRISLGDTAPLLHFAGRQDVVIWPLAPVRA